MLSYDMGSIPFLASRRCQQSDTRGDLGPAVPIGADGSPTTFGKSRIQRRDINRHQRHTQPTGIGGDGTNRSRVHVVWLRPLPGDGASTSAGGSDGEVQRGNIQGQTAVEPELSDSYQVQGTSTLIMFLEGRETGRFEGPPPTVEAILAAVTQPFES
jgi:hypothetical protein